jgi:hypothetical protein
MPDREVRGWLAGTRGMTMSTVRAKGGKRPFVVTAIIGTEAKAPVRARIF